MKITKAQKEALEVVMKLTDSGDPNKKEYILTLIYGILNIELEDESITLSITADPDKPNNTLPIDYEDPLDGNIKINMPDWIKDKQTPPFSPHIPFPPQVWYNHEPEPIQTDARDDVRYITEVTCTGDKNCIVHTTNTNDVQYNGEYEEPKEISK